MTYLLINDSNYRDHAGDGKVIDFGGPRYLAAMPRKTAFGQCAVAAMIDENDLIPRSEWPDRIRRKDRDRTWVKDICSRIPCMDQDGLNYCHAYGPTMAVMCHRLIQNQPHVMLSAESVGGPVTGWRNNGAYPEDDLQQYVQYGACPASMMDKPHSRNPGRWDPAWETERLKYRVVEWLDGLLPQGKAFDAAMTMALQNLPGAAGFTWWGHEVAYCLHAQDLGRGKFSIGGRNSWGKDYGDDGFFYLQEGKGTPDIHLFAVLHMIASG
jgi:hypothetical protein